MDRRALNRATLGRQLLLERVDRAVPDVVEHLVGLQGQAPDAPYVALWSRITGFTPDQVADQLWRRELVRTSVMRATMHLMTARDALRVRPLVHVVSDRALRTGSPFGKKLAAAGVDLAELAALGETLLAERPRTRAELADALLRRWPDADRDSLSYGVSYLVPAVQTPPRGVWGETGPPVLASVRAWLGEPAAATIDELVLRYLGAFGPATVRDVQTWSGLTRLREVADRLRPKLWADGDLLDLPDAPRPDADTPAPVRFLPEYDNLLLSHADRTRVNPDGRRVPLPPGNGARMGTVLVDGDYRADWRITAPGTLTVTPFTPLTRAERDEVTTEGAALLAFAVPDDRCEVRIGVLST